MSVLVVDDEKLVRWSISHHLRRAGYAADSVGSAEEALDRLEHQDFDVVITDIRLPGINGIELLQRLRTTNPRTRVIVITAHDSDTYRERAASLGAWNYLRKPFPMSTVTTLLGQRPPSPPSSPYAGSDASGPCAQGA